MTDDDAVIGIAEPTGVGAALLRGAPLTTIFYRMINIQRMS